MPLSAWWDASSSGLTAWPELRASAAGGPVLVWTAVAGIGAPDRFFRALENEGLTIIRRPCVDHADFAGQLPFGPDEHRVIVTEKDAVKLDPARIAAACPSTEVWVAPMVLALPDPLVDDIDRRLREAARRRGLAAPAR